MKMPSTHYDLHLQKGVYKLGQQKCPCFILSARLGRRLNTAFQIIETDFWHMIACKPSLTPIGFSISVTSDIFPSISTCWIRFYSHKYHPVLCCVCPISSAVACDQAASPFTVTLSTPVASVTADFYRRTLPQWRIWAILGGWAGGCAPRLSQSPLLVSGAPVHLPFPQIHCHSL